MTSDQDSAQRQLCPFCGKSFKRLKSHLPHCKMAPVAKETKSSKAVSEKCSDTLLRSAAAQKRTTMTTNPQKRMSDPGLTSNPAPPTTKETHLTQKAKSAKVSTNKKPPPNKPPKSRVSIQTPQVKDEEQRNEAVGVSRLEESPSLLSTGKEEGAASLTAGPSSTRTELGGSLGERTPAKVPFQPKASDTKPTGTELSCTLSTRGGAVVYNSVIAPSVPDARAVDGEGWSTKTGSHTQILFQDSAATRALGLESPSGYHHWNRVCPKTCVWDHIKGSLATKASGHLVGANQKQGSPKVWLAAVNPDPPSAVVLTSFQPKLGLEVDRDRSGSVCRNFSVPAPAQLDRAQSLEWMPELALGYHGIGFSMLPLCSCRIERVQRRPSPVQPMTINAQGCLADCALMDVKLAELPTWLMLRPSLTPRRGVASLQRGWQRYYSRYIDVRRGGIGGVAMLLAGYCVLSYICRYPHLKRERWRKYH